ncbi:MAG TPA: cytochrome c oxidase assembly factor Coa1 family protein [Pyrinomonadaceae bacterium]|nr:cytochrome c oxidase assembly factor Coa1 family protein [Pyrinomonadaceae bacterium]
MNCQTCGAPLDPATRFCQQCGASGPVAPSTSFGDRNRPPFSGASHPQTVKRKSSTGKILLVIGGVLIVVVTCLGVAGFFGVRYAMRSIRDSEANRVAVAAVKESRAASEVLGDITDVGFPLGSFSTEAGGSGEASLSMSVEGTKASGTYYSTLKRTDGVWRVTSGRVETKDGQSVDIGGQNVAAATLSGVEESGGHQMESASSVDDSDWREVLWKEQGVSVKVPAKWQPKTTNQREFEMRASDYSYLGIRTYAFGQQLPTESLLSAWLLSASEKLRNGQINGYAVKEIGGVTGVLNIYPQGDRFLVTWNGHTQRKGKNVSVDIVLSALSKDQKGLEATFSRVLDSIRFD